MSPLSSRQSPVGKQIPHLFSRPDISWEVVWVLVRIPVLFMVCRKYWIIYWIRRCRGTSGGDTLYVEVGTGCGTNPYFAGGMDGGNTIYYCASGGSGINSSVLLGAVGTSGGSSSLGISDSSSGTAITLTHK